MSTHTPVPWVSNEFLVKAPDCYGRVICDTEVSINFQPKQYVSREESRANAAFIARACNSHEDLLAALKTIKSTATGPWSRGRGEADWLDLLETIGTQASAAIAKATAAR
jgi:hypothetical protein